MQSYVVCDYTNWNNDQHGLCFRIYSGLGDKREDPFEEPVLCNNWPVNLKCIILDYETQAELALSYLEKGKMPPVSEDRLVWRQ